MEDRSGRQLAGELSGRGKKEDAKEAQTIAESGPDGLPAEAATTANGEGEVTEEALVAR